jgi:hypothetical protein
MNPVYVVSGDSPMKIKIVKTANNKPSGRICPWAVDYPPDAPSKK